MKVNKSRGISRTHQSHNDRWLILALTCLILWGQSFCYDLPASVHDHLLSYTGISKDVFPWYFNAMYSAYSLPNLLLPLLIGWVLDKSSGGTIIICLSLVACLGQFILSAGVLYRYPWVMIMGRFMFGVGCESLGVAVNSVLTHAFDGKEVAFALALNVSFARLGTISNDWISPVISSSYGTPIAFMFGLILSCVSASAAYKLSNSFLHTSRPSAASSMSAKTPGYLFWTAALICVGGYCSILPFTSVFVAIKPKNLSQQEASQVVSISFLLSALLTPALGRIVDRFGRAAWITASSAFLLCLTHAMFSSYHHSLVMVILGIAYSGFVASIWPLVPLTVEEANVGFAYGIMTALQNMGLTIVPLVVATIRFQTGSYEATRWLFLIISITTLALSTWLASELTSESKNFEIVTDPETERLSKAYDWPHYSKNIDDSVIMN